MKSIKTLTCIVVDDEPLAREVIVRYIQRVPSMQLISECGNAIEALEVIKNHNINLMFLDIRMPELSGLKLIQIVKTSPLVVLTTAYQEYALEGYELDVIDYLLKPIQFDRFLKSVNKAFRLLGNNSEPQQSNLTMQAESQNEPYLYFRTDRKTVKVLLKDIFYIEGMGNYVKVMTINSTIITKSSMTALEAMLPENLFIRAHRSFIVSRNKITSFNHDTIEIGKHQIPIGKFYRNNVLKLLDTK